MPWPDDTKTVYMRIQRVCPPVIASVGAAAGMSDPHKAERIHVWDAMEYACADGTRGTARSSTLM